MVNMTECPHLKTRWDGGVRIYYCEKFNIDIPSWNIADCYDNICKVLLTVNISVSEKEGNNR